MKKRTNKYNNSKVEFHGYTFDSQAELDYYKYLFGREEIHSIELQPEFILQPAFTNAVGKKILPIKYKADFLVTYRDGTQKVIDIKGFETTDFKLKKKMFEYVHQKELVLIKEAPKYLEPVKWIELDDYKKLARQRKKVTDLYGKKKSPEKTAELNRITEEFHAEQGGK